VTYTHIKGVECTFIQELRLCTSRTAHRGSTGIALLFLDHGTRREWGVSVTPRPLFTPGKDPVPVPIVQEDEWALGVVCTGAENLAPIGIRSPGRPACSQSLYRLSYPAHIFPYSKKNLKWNRYRPGVAQRVGRGILLLFHDSGTRRGWVVSSMLRPHFTPGKEPVSILLKAGWVPGFSLQRGYHSNPTTPKLQHTSNQEQYDQCGNSTE